MKYNGFYFALFRGTMQKVIAEHFDKPYAKQLMRQCKPLYKEIVTQAPDIGADNPMAFNMLFALAFATPYLASKGKVDKEISQEMMERALYHVKWYFAITDLNTPRGKNTNKKAVVAYYKWYTPEREKRYPTSFKVDFEGMPYEGACYYRITRCAICPYMEELGCAELMPLMCELDQLMVHLQHGVLHREKMIAKGDPYCDYFIVGNKENIGQNHKK